MTSPPPQPETRPIRTRAGVVVLIAAMSLIVLAGVDSMGWLARLDGEVACRHAGWLGLSGDAFGQSLSPLVIWVASVAAALGVPVVVTGVEGFWRRLGWWLSAMVLIAAWAPVLSLCDYRPQVSAPCLVAAFAGLVAMLCAGRDGSRADDFDPDTESDEAS